MTPNAVSLMPADDRVFPSALVFIATAKLNRNFNFNRNNQHRKEVMSMARNTPRTTSLLPSPPRKCSQESRRNRSDRYILFIRSLLVEKVNQWRETVHKTKKGRKAKKKKIQCIKSRFQSNLEGNELIGWRNRGVQFKEYWVT